MTSSQPDSPASTGRARSEVEAARVAALAGFDSHLTARGLAPLTRGRVTQIQLNIGKRCNLACHHCHVESGPLRTEQLSALGIDRIVELLKLNPEVDTLDITGGAPELHPEFRRLVVAARALGRRVIDRCNLTVFEEPGQADTPEFLAEHGVEIVASLPCYSRANVEAQRGKGVFDGSIAALQRLNALGYGRGREGDEARVLNLVYNPVGVALPPAQAELEETYRVELRELFSIEFDALHTITNMPIKRFAHTLLRDGQLREYMSLLVEHFNPDTVGSLMCRELVNIDHEGRIFDCDFNQALDLAPPGPSISIFDIDNLQTLAGHRIATGAHCFGCTAGAGSSCGGSLA